MAITFQECSNTSSSALKIFSSLYNINTCRSLSMLAAQNARAIQEVGEWGNEAVRNNTSMSRKDKVRCQPQPMSVEKFAS